MKSAYEIACEDPEFIKFVGFLNRSANYFVATHGASEHQKHAINLVIAMAFLAGKK